MGGARKVIDWHRQGGTDLERELQGLPEGRYVLVPENELAADAELTPEQEQGLIEALEAADRGELVPAEAVMAKLRARLGG